MKTEFVHVDKHIPVIKRENPLTNQQIHEGIRRIGPGDDSLEFKAVESYLDNLLMELVGDVADEATRDSFQFGRNSGAIDVVLRIKGDFVRYRKTPTPE